METVCKRCGKPCRAGVGTPDARPLRRAKEGYCADCAFTIFLQTTEPLNSIISERGVECLRMVGVREQIAKLLIVGNSDASISDINIENVIANWELESK